MYNCFEGMRPEAQHAKPHAGIPDPAVMWQTAFVNLSFLKFVSGAITFSSIIPSYLSFSPKAIILPIDGVEVLLPVHEVEAELQEQEEHEGSCSSMFCFLQQGLLFAISLLWANRTARTVSGTDSQRPSAWWHQGGTSTVSGTSTPDTTASSRPALFKRLQRHLLLLPRFVLLTVVAS